MAIALGVVAPTIFQSIKFFGDLFINLLKLFALPMICSALIAALGDLSSHTRSLKSLTKKLLSYMLLSEILAVMIALLLFNMFTPGTNCNPNLLLNGQSPEKITLPDFGFSQFVVSIFPDNIFYSLSNFELLPVVIFSIMFGIGCSFVGESAKAIIKLAIGIREVCSKCLHGVMLLAPFGIFALVGAGVSQSHLSGDLTENFSALLAFVAVLVIGLFFHGLWQLILVTLFTKQKGFVIFKKSLPLFSTAFGTSSSVATLPIAMQTADSLGSKSFVTRLVLPLTATLNVGGMMMYEVGATLFFCQMLGVDLSLSHQILIALVCILGGMAEGGIPETSLVSLVVVFRIVNIPLSAITLLLPLDRILDRLRTMVNIFGNVCGVILISHFIRQEELDAENDPILDNQLHSTSLS